MFSFEEIKNFHKLDFLKGSSALTLHSKVPITSPSDEGEISFICYKHIESNSTAYFLSFIINSNSKSTIASLMNHILLNYETIMLKAVGGISVNPGNQYEKSLGVTQDVFSKKIYFYTMVDECPTSIPSNQSISVSVRGPAFFKKQGYLHPKAFISYSSEDVVIADKIVSGLMTLNCPIWYDQIQLKVGDNKRSKIEAGIKNARKCIILLSKNYICNTREAIKEFEGIYSAKPNDILPIWYDLSEKEVRDFCLTLPNIIAERIKKDNQEDISRTILSLYKLLMFS